MKCSCSKKRNRCDSNCPLQQEEDYYTRKNIIVLLIIAFIVMISVAYCPKLQGQTPVMYGGGNIEEFLPQDNLTNSAPSMWNYADNFEGADSYIVYKEAHQQEIGKKNHLYLVGLDECGEEIMKIQIEKVSISRNKTYAIVEYNGWEIRLRK